MFIDTRCKHMENRTHGKQKKIIMHDKCNIWQPSFTLITKIKIIRKGTETDYESK